MSERDRLLARIRAVQEAHRIPMTDEQVEAIIRTAMYPKFEDRERWEDEVILQASRALLLAGRRASLHKGDPKEDG